MLGELIITIAGDTHKHWNQHDRRQSHRSGLTRATFRHHQFLRRKILDYYIASANCNNPQGRRIILDRINLTITIHRLKHKPTINQSPRIRNNSSRAKDPHSGLFKILIGRVVLACKAISRKCDDDRKERPYDYIPSD